ncbi:hypothetical protein HZH68_003134 [Vespula germanica]|uniref:Secreted protein n=1 Tax=Vespula germanica TaxID=30212 RepID=A0A834U296_VESGE|nr:hypothetical protein HZH68_003134 [Vespula germanica]
MAMPVSVGYVFSFLLVHAGVKTDENKDPSVEICAYVCTHGIKSQGEFFVTQSNGSHVVVLVLVLGADVGVSDGDGDGGSGVPRK